MPFSSATMFASNQPRSRSKKGVIAVFVIALTAGFAIGVPLSVKTSPKKKGVDYLERAKQILREVPLVDGHNDLPWNIQLNTNGELSKIDLRKDLRDQFSYKPENHPSQTDIPRMQKGMVGGQFWSAFIKCNAQYKDSVEKALQLIDLVKRFTAQYDDFFQFVTTADDILLAHRNKKVASLIGVEGGHMMANSLSVLRIFYEVGVRYMTLTWNCNTPWADYSRPERDNRTLMNDGLTEWGRSVILEMNRLGMLVDLSHVSAKTMRDVMNVTEAPVIFSHSSAFGLCPHPRNVPDDVLELLNVTDGIVMVNFYNKFLNCTLENRFVSGNRTATLGLVADHLEYLKKKVGSDRIGIGSDFDGIVYFPEGLEDTSKFPHLLAELLRRGWAEEDVKKVAGLNIIRVLKKVEEVRDSKKGQKPHEVPLNVTDIPDTSCKVNPWDAKLKTASFGDDLERPASCEN